MTAFCPRMETIHWMSPPSAKNSLLATVFYNLVHFFMLLSLHLTIGIATSPVLFNVFVTVCFSQFMQRMYVRTCTIHVNLTGKELNGLMFARDHMNRCEKSASRLAIARARSLTATPELSLHLLTHHGRNSF